MQGMRQALAQHLHRQVALITHQLDILICGKDSQHLAGLSCDHVSPLLHSMPVPVRQNSLRHAVHVDPVLRVICPDSNPHVTGVNDTIPMAYSVAVWTHHCSGP